MSNVDIKPEVGMGATYHCGSDMYPFTVARILSPKKIVLTYDAYSNRVAYVSLRKNGRWIEIGKSMNGVFFTIGERHSYRDPSF